MSHEYELTSLDLLISELTELTQTQKPKPKYEVGQEIWFIDYPSSKYETNIKIINLPVISIDCDLDVVRYFFSSDYGYEIKEQDLYLSREELIETQIEYWQSLLPLTENSICQYDNTLTDKMKIQCQHVSDDQIYTSYPPQHRCKKCGEFYR